MTGLPLFDTIQSVRMSYLVIEARVIKSSQENLTWRSDHLH